MVVGWVDVWLVVVACGLALGFDVGLGCRWVGVACWPLVGVPLLWAATPDVPAPTLLAHPAVAMAMAMAVSRARFIRTARMEKG